MILPKKVTAAKTTHDDKQLERLMETIKTDESDMNSYSWRLPPACDGGNCADSCTDFNTGKRKPAVRRTLHNKAGGGYKE